MMNCIEDEVFEFLDTPNRTLEEKLAYLNQHSLQDWHKTQTGAVIRRFYLDESLKTDLNSDQTLHRIALALRKTFGSIAVECEGTCCAYEFVTLLDDVVGDHRYKKSLDGECEYCSEYNNVCFRFAKAMRDVGFMHAYEVDTIDLLHEYVCHYADDKIKSGFKYSYEDMRMKRAPLAEDLAKYFFNPSRLSEWMEENPDKEIEEYMA